MTSFVERQVNQICGRWLDGFTKDNVDVSLLQANVTLSNVRLKTDELCLLSPMFAPKHVSVGKMSLDIPLVFNFDRPLAITVSDVMVVVKVVTHNISYEEARKAVNANVHMREILDRFASDIGGGAGEEASDEKDEDGRDGSSTKGASTVTLGTVAAIQKIAQKMEITIKNAHIRLEETGGSDNQSNADANANVNAKTAATGKGKDGLAPAAAAATAAITAPPYTTTRASSPPSKLSSSPPPPPALSTVAFGVCLRQVSVEPDSSKKDGKGGAGRSVRARGKGSRWIGRKYLEMERSVLGDSNSQRQAGVSAASDNNSGVNDADSASTKTTWSLGKFASVRGLSAYFGRDEECYSPENLEETLNKMRERSVKAPEALSLLLRRCRAGLGVKAVMSAEVLGLVESLDVRLAVGDIDLQATDDHLEYLLRWTSLFKDRSRALVVAATRPVAALAHPDPAPRPTNGGAGSSFTAGAPVLDENARRKARYYRALWKYAKEMVSRDLKVLAKKRFKEALKQGKRDDDHLERTQPWRLRFSEWVSAARYIAARELLHSYLVVDTFDDECGGVHDNLYEDLELQPEILAEGNMCGPKKQGVVKVLQERKLGKHLMPWQLPRRDVLKAWNLIRRKCFRWETRQVGGIRLALDKEQTDVQSMGAGVIQALWSIQLQMDARLPHGLCAAARRMAVNRVQWRRRMDALWQARAEKQRRLGLGPTAAHDTLARHTPSPPPPAQHQHGQLQQPQQQLHGFQPAASGADEAGGERKGEGVLSERAQDSMAAAAEASAAAGAGGRGGTDHEVAAGVCGVEDGNYLEGDGDGADRVGTLLVRMGQLDGVGGIGVFSLAPKAVAKVMLEESSARVEDLEMETAYTKEAKYDGKSARCVWDEAFRLQVELAEFDVLELRRERSRHRHHRRTSSPYSASSTSTSRLSSSPLKPHDSATAPSTTSSPGPDRNPPATPPGNTPAATAYRIPAGMDSTMSPNRLSLSNSGGGGRGGGAGEEEGVVQDDDRNVTAGSRSVDERVDAVGGGGGDHHDRKGSSGSNDGGIQDTAGVAAVGASTLSRNRTGTTDSAFSCPQVSDSPRSSFLLSVSCVDKGVFGDNDLGSVTLPSKELTAVPLKVMEHRCTLFSPRAVGKDLVDLTFHTVYVPPGEDVGRCEHRLKDVAKLRRRQEREDAVADPLPSSDPPVLKENASWGVGKARRGLSPPSPPPPGRTPGLQQPTFGEVGTHEVQLRPTRSGDNNPRSSSVVAGGGSGHNQSSTDSNSKDSRGTTTGTTAPTTPTTDTSLPSEGQVQPATRNAIAPAPTRRRLSSTREIPVAEHINLPEKVIISARLAGIKGTAHLNYSAATARGGRAATGGGLRGGGGSDGGQPSSTRRDLLVTAGKVLASRIEACFDLDVKKGEMGILAEAAMIEVTDNCLLCPDATAVPPSGFAHAPSAQQRQQQQQQQQPRGSASTLPQVLRVGPLGFETRATPQSDSLSSTSTTTRQSSAAAEQHPATHSCGAGEEQQARGDTPEKVFKADRGLPSGDFDRFDPVVGGWRWTGRMRLGAHTAELGDWNPDEARPLYEVWRRLRFVLPGGQAFWQNHESQVLRGSAAVLPDRHDAGTAESSFWLYRAGGRRLSIDVKIPVQDAREVSRASSPIADVYVSSDEDGPESAQNEQGGGRLRRRSDPWGRRRSFKSSPETLRSSAKESFPSTATASSCHGDENRGVGDNGENDDEILTSSGPVDHARARDARGGRSPARDERQAGSTAARERTSQARKESNTNAGTRRRAIPGDLLLPHERENGATWAAQGEAGSCRRRVHGAARGKDVVAGATEEKVAAPSTLPVAGTGGDAGSRGLGGGEQGHRRSQSVSGTSTETGSAVRTREGMGPGAETLTTAEPTRAALLGRVRQLEDEIASLRQAMAEGGSAEGGDGGDDGGDGGAVVV